MLSTPTDQTQLKLRSVPKRFQERTLAGYKPETPSAHKALDAARLMVDAGGGSLVLVGPPGVGKSHLAAGISRLIALQLWEVHVAAMAVYEATHDRIARRPKAPDMPEWVNVAELIVGLREDMDRPLDDRSWADRSRELRTHKGLVVLDDLGREKASDWTGEVIYALINARYEALLSTIATSNLSPDELRASPYWPAISRLAEDGALVRIEASDWRLRKP